MAMDTVPPGGLMAISGGLMGTGDEGVGGRGALISSHGLQVHSLP